MALASKSAPDSTCPFLQPPQYATNASAIQTPETAQPTGMQAPPVGLTTSAKTPKGSSLFSEAVPARIFDIWDAGKCSGGGRIMVKVCRFLDIWVVVVV